MQIYAGKEGDVPCLLFPVEKGEDLAGIDDKSHGFRLCAASGASPCDRPP